MPERNLSVVEGFAARLEVLSYNQMVTIHTGQLHAELARSGTPAEPDDQLIAGHARSRGLIVVTHIGVSSIARRAYVWKTGQLRRSN
jgi:tRNA(fMet)-specific endonuclease VapC